MKSSELREKFLTFFEKNGHTIVPSSSLLPTDPSVLFTTAGMQQFKPYYLGEESPYGKNVASCQKCIRTSDIEEVGDERHLTFFEMLGNFSFGGYWKEEAIELAYKFVVDELKLEIDYVTVFEGNDAVPFDKESYNIWKSLGVPEGKIKKFGVEDNFWGPTGNGGPCGPTTEIYVNGIEIWNIVFNEFYFPGSREELLSGNSGKVLEKLKIQGIDTGMGLERLAAVVQNVPTVFDTDLFQSVINLIKEKSGSNDEESCRIIADHLRASLFLVSDGITPSNKGQGYILRRLIRRAVFRMKMLMPNARLIGVQILEEYIKQYSNIYPQIANKQVSDVIRDEEGKFNQTLSNGMKRYNEGEDPFILFTTYGFPIELTAELKKRDKKPFNLEDFNTKLTQHQELSKTASAGMFKGGLADTDPETVKLHTAHHLLLAALQELFGKMVKQRGSNITRERLRLDFSFDRKLTDEEKKKLEDMVNEQIQQGLDVIKREMPKEEAEKIGAEMEFGVKYGNTVSVYFIEDKNGHTVSKEFCGGPHVSNTAELGKFKIQKEEASSAGVRRIKAVLE